VRLLLLAGVSLVKEMKLRMRCVPCGTTGRGHRDVKVIGVGVPLSVVVLWYCLRLLVSRGSNLNWLNIVVRDNVIWLWWVALILCIVLINLSLCVLRYCWSSLIGDWCSVIVVSVTRGVLTMMLAVSHAHGCIKHTL
jgi:hypothetical protein